MKRKYVCCVCELLRFSDSVASCFSTRSDEKNSAPPSVCERDHLWCNKSINLCSLVLGWKAKKREKESKLKSREKFPSKRISLAQSCLLKSSLRKFARFCNKKGRSEKEERKKLLRKKSLKKCSQSKNLPRSTSK